MTTNQDDLKTSSHIQLVNHHPPTIPLIKCNQPDSENEHITEKDNNINNITKIHPN